jgi:hypothetical protein
MGNAYTHVNRRIKNRRRGMEKNWNQYSEPVKNMLGGTDHWKKYQEIKDVKDELHSIETELKEMALEDEEQFDDWFSNL